MEEKERDLRRLARTKFASMVKSGEIKRVEKCQQCGNLGRIEAHHHNGYVNAADVVWLCVPCHKKHHIKDLYVFTTETRGHRSRVSGKEPTVIYTIRVGRLLFKALRLIGPDLIRQWLTDYAVWRLKTKNGLQDLDKPIVLQIKGTEEK